MQAANCDPLVHGIMIYYPCFGMAPSFYGGNMDDYLRDSVPIDKDVEGLCHTYRHHLYHNIRFIDNEVRHPRRPPSHVCCVCLSRVWGAPAAV